MPLPGLPCSDEQLFQSLNGCLIGWTLLLLLPRWRLTIPIVTLICVVYSALYVGCMAFTILQGATICSLLGLNWLPSAHITRPRGHQPPRH